MALLYALATAALAAWICSRTALNDRVMAIVPAAAIVGACLGWQVLRPLQGRLAWDGAGWHHLSGGSAERRPLQGVQLQMDLGNWLLLRIGPTGARRAAWCGISIGDAGPSWHGLRLALYHRAPTGALAGGPS